MGLCFGKADNTSNNSSSNNNNTSSNAKNRLEDNNNTTGSTNNNANNNNDENNGTTGGNNNYDIKLLLLGSGESGKSTFFRQVRILTQETPFREEERRKTKTNIYANVIQSMAQICMKMKEKNIAFASKELEESADRIIELSKSRTFIQITTASRGKEGEKVFYTDQVANDIESLWNEDKQVQDTFFTFRNECHVYDGANYFFKKLQEIKQASYLPSDEDLIHTRQKTLGIVEANFVHKGLKISLFDVGGQRNERKKWINCFEGVSAVIYIASLADYDLQMYEDETLNRMEDSLTVFEGLCNGYFKDTPILLVLNKLDVFKEKVEKRGINCCFKDYTDDEHDTEKSLNFIKNKFLGLNKFDKDRIFIYEACATNTDMIRNVFEEMKDQVAKFKK
ncbi:hypothetical protein ABK040_007339 [Willaertia magna]